MSFHDRLLSQVLTEDVSLESLTVSRWDLLLRQARSSLLLGQVANIANKHPQEHLPLVVANHLHSARLVSERQKITVLWEVQQLREVFAPLSLPVVLLKGAAYAVAGLPPAAGRTFNDIDILVPTERIEDVETALLGAGWVFVHDDEYDQKYFRSWMHELPPMQHPRRRTMLDVHHNLLPPPMNPGLDAASLIRDSVSVAEDESIRVLATRDVILHSAAHLFYNGEFDSGLRDLYDLRVLLQYYFESHEWSDLETRADELRLAEPLNYAVRYTEKVFGPPIGPARQHSMNDTNSSLRMRIMDALFLRAFHPMLTAYDACDCRLARLVLFLRGHLLRMPLWILIPHLIRKSLPRKTSE